MEQEGVEQQIFLQPEMAVIGGGDVSSVNGFTGDVVLTTSDLENTSDYQTGSEVAAAIGVETAAREAADNNLQTQIDAISASSDVTDIVGTYAELQNYDTSTLGDNDIIKVLQDESQNDETTYYRWSTTTQSFTLIGEEGPYYTKAQADVLLNAKQDELTAGANIQISNNTISATDTTYSDFTGTDGTAAGAAGLVPAPATTDAGKFLKADGTWDNAGSAINVVQTTGTSTTSVMSQNATTNMVFDDPGTNSKVKIGASSVGTGGVSIGKYAGGTGNYSVAIGSGSSNSYGPWSAGRGSIAIGENAHMSGGAGGVVRDYGIAIGANSIVNTGGHCEIALGAYSKATQQGQMDISTLATTNKYGYNNSQYRLLTGLYDPQNDHDAATKGYVDTAVAGAGGGVTVVQTTGTSTTDVMSQNATTGMVFADPSTKYKIGISSNGTITNQSNIEIGSGVYASGTGSIAIGHRAQGGSGDSTTGAIAIGGTSVSRAPSAIGAHSIALGDGSRTNTQGVFTIGGLSGFTGGYNNSSYRLLTGLYDGQSAHDAVNVSQINSVIDNINSALNTNIPHIGV